MNILTCDICGADAGNDPYHATVNNNGHVHICAACFDPQQHDVGVLKQQRDELLAALQDALGDLEYLKNAPDSAYARSDDETIKTARAAIAKAGGAV